RDNILETFEKIEGGELLVKLSDGAERRFGTKGCGPPVKLVVKSEALWVRVALFKDLGLAESFMAGECEISDLSR
ncbi:hypothetical protein L0F63_005997, partial [Massospora cicadina]